MPDYRFAVLIKQLHKENKNLDIRINIKINQQVKTIDIETVGIMFADS